MMTMMMIMMTVMMTKHSPHIPPFVLTVRYGLLLLLPGLGGEVLAAGRVVDDVEAGGGAGVATRVGAEAEVERLRASGDCAVRPGPAGGMAVQG